MIRRPLLGRHGRAVIIGLCGYELVAVAPGSPLPTLSAIVSRHRLVGVTLLVLLTHHWFIEQEKRL